VTAINAPTLVDQLGAVAPGVQVLPVGPVMLTSNVDYQIDLTSPYLRAQVAALQSVYVNNWSNDGAILVKAPATGQTVVAPPFSVGWYPLFVPASPPRVTALFAPTRTLASASVSFVLTNALIAQGPTLNNLYADTPPVTAVVVSAAGVGDNTLVPAIASQTIRVHGALLQFSAALNATFKSAATARTGAMPFAANGTLNLPFSETPYFETASGEAFVVNLSAAGAYGALYYRQSV